MHWHSRREGCCNVQVPRLRTRAPRHNKKDNSKTETRAITMLDLDKFKTRLKTGIEYAGCEMGWTMDIKRAGSVCPTSGIKRMRYGHWKERPLLWEVLAYAILDILTELEAFNWDSRLFLKSHNLD